MRVRSPIESQRCFDPRPRAEGDGCQQTSPPTPCSFDPRPRAEGDADEGVMADNAPSFRSTPSRGGRRSRNDAPARRKGFDPRPRAEGDHPDFLAPMPAEVSIHALARRATRRGRDPIRRRAVSIHALARRATWTSLEILASGLMFRSTPSRGGRLRTDRRRSRSKRCFDPRPRAEGDGDLRRARRANAVSIHALARRATRDQARPRRDRDRFDPRPRAEGDRGISI